MKTFLPFLLLLVSFQLMAQAEKDSLLARDAEQLIEEMRFMYQVDQRTRKYLDYGSFEKRVTDSIENLSAEATKHAEISLQLPKPVKDRIWSRFISPLDSLKAARMMEIIETYGYPSGKRLRQFSEQEIDFNPLVLLGHTPFNFKDRMIPLLEREYRAGNLPSSCEYGYLLWHLHGRSDFSYMLDNGYEMTRNEDGTFRMLSTCE